VGADLRAETVLQRRDDAAPVGVVLGVRAGHEHDVERQPQRVAADPDVALLQDVQQRYLDALGEVRQLVQAEDAAVGAGHEAEVDGFRVAERTAFGHLDRVDVADQVADAGVGRGELLAVTVVLAAPCHRQVVAELGGQPPAAGARRAVRVVVDLASGDGRRPLVEQPYQGPDQPRLSLAAFAEQDDVVPGHERPLDVRQHGLVESDDARKPVLPGPHSREQVLSYLLLDGSLDVAAGTKLAEGGRRGRAGAPSACAGLLAVLLHVFDTMSATCVFASSAGHGGGYGFLT